MHCHRNTEIRCEVAARPSPDLAFAKSVSPASGETQELRELLSYRRLSSMFGACGKRDFKSRSVTLM